MVIQQQIITAAHQEKLRQLSVQAAASTIMPIGHIGGADSITNFNMDLIKKISAMSAASSDTNTTTMIMPAKALTTVRATTKKRCYNRQNKTTSSYCMGGGRCENPNQRTSTGAYNNDKRTRFVMNDAESKPTLPPTATGPPLSNFIHQGQQHYQQAHCTNAQILPENYLKQNDAALNISSEPFVTPPPSQPPASLLLSPSLDGSTTTTASMLFRVRNHAEQQPSLAASNVYPQPQPQHFTYPPAASPLLHNSSLLMTPPEILPTVAQKCDDTTTVGAKSHQQNLSDVKNYQNSNDQSNQNIVSFMSAFTKQQQENQQHLSNNNKPMLEGIMSAANGITTTGNNYQTGTTLALNQLIGNSAPQQQLKYDNQHGGQWEQTQKLQPASANTAASFSLLLALLQQQQQQQEQQEQHEKQQQEQQKQQQQDANIAAQQTLLLHLTLQKELQLLQQQVIANATAQMQHQQQQQQTQQQQTQVIAPELLQHVQLLLQQNGTAINVDDLDKQLKQQQQLPGSNFLSPPLTHTPLSVADDLNSSSPLSFNLLNVNASRSSPATHVSGRLKLCNTDNNFIERHQTTQPQSHTKYQQQQPADVSNYQPSSNGNTCVSLAEDGCQRNDKNSIIVSRYDDLDAFERAIAQRHGDLTDRESLAVAVLAAGLTAARN